MLKCLFIIIVYCIDIVTCLNSWASEYEAAI